MTTDLNNERLKVLLVDDDLDIHFLVKEYLSEKDDLFVLDAVLSLDQAYESVAIGKPDVVLLDLSLTANPGLDSFNRFRSQVNGLPVVIFTSLDDESAALEAVKKGAQDYLVKGHVTPRMLTQVLRYSVERYRTQGKARNPQLTDVVTGLHNAEGFAVFAEQALRSSSRNLNGTVVFLFVLEQLKLIESRFGQGEAHNALKITTEILRESFRVSDILARVGYDRFVVLPASSSPFLSSTVMSRIKASQTYYNSRFNLYRILLRWQVHHFPADGPLSIDELMAKIGQDFSAYDEKVAASKEKQVGSPNFPPARS